MQLTVRDVTQMFNVHESMVYRWANNHELPAELINGQFRFNRTELLEWAADKKLQISPEFFRIKYDNGGACTGFDAALRLGGVHHDVPGQNLEEVLRSLVGCMPLPPDFDRALLLEVLASRESVGSTGLGDGLAIPHPRFPIVLPAPHSFITLCFLQQPIAYGKSALGPVHTVFALIATTVRHHLNLLARLSFALRDEPFRDAVHRKESADVLLQHAARIEAILQSAEAPAAAAAATGVD